MHLSLYLSRPHLALSTRTACVSLTVLSVCKRHCVSVCSVKLMACSERCFERYSQHAAPHHIHWMCVCIKECVALRIELSVPDITTLQHWTNGAELPRADTRTHRRFVRSYFAFFQNSTLIPHSCAYSPSSHIHTSQYQVFSWFEVFIYTSSGSCHLPQKLFRLDIADDWLFVGESLLPALNHSINDSHLVCLLLFSLEQGTTTIVWCYE